MKVKWDVCFRVWHVFAIGQIEGHIKEVYDIFVVIFKLCSLKMLQRSFLIRSTCDGGIPRPSSLCRPCLSLILKRRYA